ncbi:MAG: hypothetical protein M3Y13_12590 [Armatimonadota bacterium]|nr:hypothetical protein [Armatimonadota bacterium]
MSPEFSFQSPSPLPDPTLRRMFGALVERAFLQTLGVYESHVADYLADVLADFAHMQHVYKIKDLQGRTLQDVADMLLHADVRLEATSFNREREVHKHIGDFTLFWAGVYPEALPRLQTQPRRDHLLDYVQQGKNSYAIAASHDYGEYRREAPTLRKLSEEFELCLFGLHAVRQQMDGLGKKNAMEWAA